MTKAPRAVQASGVSICWEKMTPAKTKRFLTHWRGRSEARRARAGPTPPPLQPDHMRLGAERPREVAHVEHEPRLADEPPRIELAMGGEHRHEIIGGQIGGRPRYRVEPAARHVQARHMRVGVLHAGP